MNITDVRIRKMTKEGNMKAVASVTLDNEFAIHDIKIIEGEKGLFIAGPCKETGDSCLKNPKLPENFQQSPFPGKVVVEHG